MTVADRQIVAVRHADHAGHKHISKVKLADGTVEDAADVLRAIGAHDAHYVMDQPGLPLPLLVRSQQCPDCAEEVLWA